MVDGRLTYFDCAGLGAGPPWVPCLAVDPSAPAPMAPPGDTPPVGCATPLPGAGPPWVPSLAVAPGDPALITSGRSAASSSHLSQYFSGSSPSIDPGSSVSSSLTLALGTLSAAMVQSHCSLFGCVICNGRHQNLTAKPEPIAILLPFASDHTDSVVSADFHNQASQKDAVKRSRLANHSSFLRCSPA